MLCLKYLEPTFSKDLVYTATVSKDSFHGFQQHLKVITLSASETLRYQIRYPENEENTVKKTTSEIPALCDFQCLFLHFPSVMPFFISCTSSKSCMSPKFCECYPTEKEASFLKNCTPPANWKLNIKSIWCFPIWPFFSSKLVMQ